MRRRLIQVLLSFFSALFGAGLAGAYGAFQPSCSNATPTPFAGRTYRASPSFGGPTLNVWTMAPRDTENIGCSVSARSRGQLVKSFFGALGGAVRTSARRMSTFRWHDVNTPRQFASA